MLPLDLQTAYNALMKFGSRRWIRAFSGFQTYRFIFGQGVLPLGDYVAIIAAIGCAYGLQRVQAKTICLGIRGLGAHADK